MSRFCYRSKSQSQHGAAISAPWSVLFQQSRSVHAPPSRHTPQSRVIRNSVDLYQKSTTDGKKEKRPSSVKRETNEKKKKEEKEAWQQLAASVSYVYYIKREREEDRNNTQEKKKKKEKKFNLLNKTHERTEPFPSPLFAFRCNRISLR